MDGLRLVWALEHLTLDDDVLDNLQSHPNLRVLGVINPGIAAGPCWSYGDMTRKKLVSLLVEGLSWDSLPPFEQRPYLTKLILKNIIGMTVFGPGFGGVTEASFVHLKTILFENMPQLVEWVGVPNSHLFSTLESITFRDCPLLCSFPFLECSGRFTNLSTLHIGNCPMLSQFPPMPHNSTLRSMIVRNSVSEVEVSYNGHSLSIDGYNGALVFHNMNKVELIKIRGVSCISLSEIQKLKSLRTVDVQRCDNMFTAELDDSVVLYSVQNLVLQELCIKGELFSKVLKCFPALSRLVIQSCMDLDLLPVDDGGLGDLTMLESCTVLICAKLFSRWPMGEAVGAHTIKPFPRSLTILEIVGDKSMKSMALLSNLTCLTILRLVACEEFTMDGFNPLMTVNLKELIIYNNNYRFTDKENISIARDLLSEVGRSKLMHAGSFQLERLNVDSIMALLIAPICSHLAGTLYKLEFSHDNLVKSFTEEQEQALQLLISLQELTFDSCSALQSLPEGLHHIPSLRKLEISFCDRIQLLPPKEGLPASLQILQVRYCSSELTELANKLKETDPYFSALLEGM
jgi:Leucine-rich repeat (LRR) protein